MGIAVIVAGLYPIDVIGKCRMIDFGGEWRQEDRCTMTANAGRFFIFSAAQPDSLADPKGG
jgi:hypothetical protein